MPFGITRAQLAVSNKLFQPLAVGDSPAASAGPRARLVIDASQDPGVELLATFVPAVSVAGGVSRIAGMQVATAIVPIVFDEALPLYWMAAVLRIGDIAPNQQAQAYASDADAFELRFEDIVIAHDSGGWQLPAFDTGLYAVNVGFGIGAGFAAWGYSVPCDPRATMPIAAGGYQFVRSDGEGDIGEPIPANADAWTMRLGSSYTLTFGATGTGTLTQD